MLVAIVTAKRSWPTPNFDVAAPTAVGTVEDGGSVVDEKRRCTCGWQEYGIACRGVYVGLGFQALKQKTRKGCWEETHGRRESAGVFC
jgi:hypothetical protein